jgi:hypothetical protein
VVAYPSWITLGLLAGYSARPKRTSTGGGRKLLLAHGALAVVVILVVASVPIRIASRLAQIDMSRVSYGFYQWDTWNDGSRYRWMGPRGTFFMRSSVRRIRFPIARIGGLVGDGINVDVLVDGLLAEHIVLRNRGWQEVSLNAPRLTGRFWRVDLRAGPTWTWTPGVPSVGIWLIRPLSVTVGEIQIDRQLDLNQPE